MDTSTAAQQAGVTVATIRAWCRRNVIGAIKIAGRWVIDAASLAYRITLTPKVTMDAPVYLTNKTQRVRGHIAAVAPAAQLAAAFAAGQPVTLAGKFAGERVYLGHTRQTWDDGVTVETIGLDRTWTHEGREIAAYLIDVKRLDEAPRLAALVAQVEARQAENAATVEARVRAEEQRLETMSEDGA
jgi:hypothetical protein